MSNIKLQDIFLPHTNTRSLAKNLNQVKDLLISIDKIPDIIAISETKLRDGGRPRGF